MSARYEGPASAPFQVRSTDVEPWPSKRRVLLTFWTDGADIFSMTRQEATELGKRLIAAARENA